jgi:hypothetical protein
MEEFETELEGKVTLLSALTIVGNAILHSDYIAESEP